MRETYLYPTQEVGKAFIERNITGSVVMLNLLRFREYADYSGTPHLASATPITGKMAYQLYMEHTLPHLIQSGGEVLFYGKGGQFLIGPIDEVWDAVLLVSQQSVDSFIAFTSDAGYLEGIGHRTAALLDSRLLPLIESQKQLTKMVI